MKLEDYGHFEDNGRIFCITRPDTPAPWINYIGNGRLMGLVSNAGGGYTYWVCPRDSRLTRHRYNSLPWDRPGRYLYIRNEKGELWSPTWQPVGVTLESYSCRHAPGYTEFESAYDGVRARMRLFVPREDDVEIWRIQLENTSSAERTLSLSAYVEFVLGHALVDLINQPNDQHFNRTDWDEEAQILFATKNYWVQYSKATVAQPNKGWDKEVFFASSLPVSSFESHKETFVGRWRSETDPHGAHQPELSNSLITAGDACGALRSHIHLAPEASLEFVVLLGVSDVHDRSAAASVVGKYREMAAVDEAAARLESWWDGYLSAVTVETPDESTSIMLNYWAKKQTWTTYTAARSAGYYHGGLLFGTGVRDSAQDLLGPLIADASMADAKISTVLSHQFADGSTLHNWFPLTGEGEKTGHSDTPLWIPLAISSYVKETGDLSYLERRFPWQDGGEDTALEHLIRSIDYTLYQKLSPRKLPLFGPGDWNDTLDYVGRQGRGESVWVAEFLCYGLRETSELLKRTGHSRKASEYDEWYQKIADAVNALAWDGEWYVRGFRDDGGVIGSSQNQEGQIFLNAQSWAVMSGIAKPERGRLAMDSAYRLCETVRGPKILSPAYRHVDPGIGLATRCVPGKKENGAIFNHPVSWAIIAEAMLGNGDRAFEYHRRTNPINQAHDPDVYKMEPYVWCEYVTSDEHPEFGQGSHSWLTGSAVWMYRGALDWILGVRPDYDGLVVDPALPSSWESARVKRRFRGALYDIAIHNPNRISGGSTSLKLNGRPVGGNLIPHTDGDQFSVECTITP
ncbi:MAG: glycosyl transferase family 36 [Armatimonadetes bacterium]|nr:glycosyl transferase family 36 [Armatimonadota bacterium]